VPCCPKCNRLKGDDWPVAGPSIFNLYYDHFPDQPYLSVDILIDAAGIPVVRFGLQRVHGIGQIRFRRIKRHFEKLELLTRYDDAGVDAVLTYKDTCTEHDFEDADELTSHLLSEATGLETRHGANYWKALVAKKLSETQAFIDQIV
jgi:hypothetical protein